MKSDFIWMDGEMLPFEKATLHFLTPALHYGAAVFEGIRAYDTDKGPAVFRLREHIERLLDSALVFGFRPVHPNWTRKARKEREEEGRSTPARVVKKVRYRLDGAGFQDERQHIWVCQVPGGEATQVTRGDYDDESPAWSPDGKSIALVSNRSPDPDHYLYRMDIWTVPAAGGKMVKVATPVGPKTALAWSPDGKWIAYYGPEVRDDPWKPMNDRLWIVSRRGGNARCLSMGVDRTAGNATLADSREVAAMPPLWSPDSRRIYITLSDRGSCHLYAVDAASCTLTPPVTKERVLTISSQSASRPARATRATGRPCRRRRTSECRRARRWCGGSTGAPCGTRSSS